MTPLRSPRAIAVAAACTAATLATMLAGCGSSGGDDATSAGTQASSAPITATTGVVTVGDRPARQAAADDEPAIPGVVTLNSRAEMRQWLSERGNRPAVIVYGAAWCGPCTYFNSGITTYLEKASDPADLRARTAYGDVDSGIGAPGNGIPIAMRYQDGRETGPSVRGAMPYSRLSQKLDDLYW